jgi:predicted RNA polymerase sigma factor
VAGLLALMLLTDARRAARLSSDGSLVPLAEQDRTLWDQRQIREGIRLVEHALPTGPVGAFQLQAAIAAVHSEARRAAGTDWAQIEILYRMLAHLTPSAVITLNHAVAVAMVEGPAAGLEMLGPLEGDRQMHRNHRLHAVRAHLLEMEGRFEDARPSYAVAARLATSIPEQRYLNGTAAQRERGHEAKCRPRGFWLRTTLETLRSGLPQTEHIALRVLEIGEGAHTGDRCPR